MKTIAVFAIACVAACASKNPKRPAELGDCISTPDAACANPIAGGAVGGGAGSPADSGAPTTFDASISGTPDTGVCGTADSLISAANLALCQRCIVTNCCSDDQACTGACASLLQCTQGPKGCNPMDQGCIDRCKTTWSDGFSAYQALALCSSGSCSSQCPILPQ